MFDSGVLTTAYADVVLPATADAEEGAAAAMATQNIGMHDTRHDIDGS